LDPDLAPDLDHSLVFSQKHGSGDLDLHQNVTDPQHWYYLYLNQGGVFVWVAQSGGVWHSFGKEGTNLHESSS
jgi:hypothetical protein